MNELVSCNSFQPGAAAPKLEGVMRNYKIKDSLTGRKAAIAKAIKAAGKECVVHLGLDIELNGAAVALSVQGGCVTQLGKANRERIVEWVKELVAMGCRVVTVQEACGFGYEFHRQLEAAGARSLMVGPRNISGKRKTDARDAEALTLDGYDYTERGQKRKLKVVHAPSREQQQRRKLERERQWWVKRRNQVNNHGSSLLHDFDYLEVPEGWWGRRKWPKLREKLLEFDPWLVEQLEPLVHEALFCHDQIRKLQDQLGVVRRDGTGYIKGLGSQTTIALNAEVIDWNRFNNRKQVGSLVGCSPKEYSSGDKQVLGSIDRMGNKRMRTLLVEAVWRLETWNPEWRGLKKWAHALGPNAKVGPAAKKKAVVACARMLAIDIWRIETGQIKPEDVGLVMTG